MKTITVSAAKDLGNFLAKDFIADLMQDWRRLDERIETVSTEIEALALQDDSCQRLMTVPGVGPIISSAMVAHLQPVAASIVPHDWPAASMFDASVALGVLGAALVAALCLGLGLALRLPATPVASKPDRLSPP